MTGMDCILCSVLWSLLSGKTEAENTSLLTGFYEITAWRIHFWGYVYITVSMDERDRERRFVYLSIQILKYLGGDSS